MRTKRTMANYSIILGTVIIVLSSFYQDPVALEHSNEETSLMTNSRRSRWTKVQLDHLTGKLDIEKAHHRQAKSATRSLRAPPRKLQEQLNECQANIQSKTVAIKQQAQLLAELEKQAQALTEQLRRCKAAEYDKRTIATSCMSFDDSRLHMVKLPHSRAFQAACDSRVAGPGWMVIQRRLTGAVSFYRSWKEYRSGFGDLRREFFIGLQRLHQLTQQQPHELFIHLQDVHNVTKFARYDNFRIGNESTDYSLLSLGAYSGDAGDALRVDEGMKFTTYDRDNDRMLDRNCAQFAHGAWWYKSCSWNNLNGGYFNAKDEEMIWWRVGWKPGTFTRLKTVIMLIRPKQFQEFAIEIKS